MAEPQETRGIAWSRPLVCAALDGAELIKARFLAHRFPRHAHADFVLGFVGRGAKRSRHGLRDLIVGDGTAMLLNPFEEHSTDPVADGWTYAAVYPSAKLVADYLGDGTLRFERPLRLDRRMNLMISGLHDAAAGGCAALELQTRFAELLALLRATGTGKAPEGEGSAREAARMRMLLDGDLADEIGLAQLAEAAGLPRVTALRSFRRQTGCTPHVYRTARRIAAAKAGLLRGEPIAEVAIANGFFDQSHLTRTFRRWTGMTPRGFVRAAG